MKYVFKSVIWLLLACHLKSFLLLKQDQSHPLIKRIIKNVEFEFKSEENIVSSVLKKRSYNSFISSEPNPLLTIQVDIDGQTFNLEIEENYELFHQSFQHIATVNNVGEIEAKFMKGHVVGHPNSVVRLTLYDGSLMEGSFILDITDTENQVFYHFEIATEADEGGYHLLKRSVGGQSNNMLKTVAYRSDEVIEFEDLHCDVKHDGPDTQLPRAINVHLAKRSGASSFKVPDNPDCPVAVIADITAFRKYGNNTLTFMLSIMNEVQGMYLSQMNLGLPVVYAHIATTANDTSGFGNPQTTHGDLLTGLETAAQTNKLPNFANISSSICLIHLFTVQNFGMTIGYANLKGACKKGYNTGLSTGIFGLSSGTILDLSRSSKLKVVAHELGHGLGAPHDEDYPTNYPISPTLCNPTIDKYLMYSSIRAGGNSATLSSCAKYHINSFLSQYTCLVDRGSQQSKTISRAPYTDLVYEYIDKCRILLGNNYAECPFELTTDPCRLMCDDITDSSISCLPVSQSASSPLISKTDGSICKVNYPRPDICVSGSCVPDTRSYVCDRSEPCCDQYGIPKPVGTSCSVCTNRYNISTCTRNYVCGAGVSVAQCIPASQTNPCSMYPCSAGKKCTDINGAAVCQEVGKESCSNICASNSSSSYVFSDGTSWSCDCRSNCEIRGTCCSDYSQSCLPKTTSLITRNIQTSVSSTIGVVRSTIDARYELKSTLGLDIPNNSETDYRIIGESGNSSLLMGFNFIELIIIAAGVSFILIIVVLMIFKACKKRSKNQKSVRDQPFNNNSNISKQ